MHGGWWWTRARRKSVTHHKIGWGRWSHPGEASVFNMRFLDDLVKEGRAEQHSFNGYPNRYTVPAGDFVPFIIDGPPVED